MSKHILRSTILALVAFFFVGVAAAQQKSVSPAAPAPTAPAAPAAPACFPECRAGFTCSDGKCVAAAPAAGACFPECREGFHCNEAKACVADRSAPAAAPDAPAAAPESQDPALTVEATETAEVFVDGGRVGAVTKAEPLVLRLPQGKHTLKLEYADGGSDSQKVYVLGEPQTVKFGASSTRLAANARLGKIRWGLGGGLGGLFGMRDFEDVDYPMVAPAVTGVLSYGVSRGVDLQAGASFTAGFNTELPQQWLLFALEPQALFHLGSVYTMAAGVRIGVGPNLSEYGDVFGIALFSARGSLVGFQFGPEREHTIQITNELGVAIDTGFGSRLGVIGVDVRYVVYPF